MSRSRSPRIRSGGNARTRAARALGAGIAMLVSMMAASAVAASPDPTPQHDAHARHEAAAPSSPHASHHDHDAMSHPSAATPSPTTPSAAPAAAVPEPTDADRAAAFPALATEHAHGDRVIAMLTVDRLEAWSHDGEPGQHWALQGWVGGDLQRVWLRSEGEREDGRLASGDIEALYGRSVAPWWDVVVGVRHDLGPGARRDWAALGVQGVSPYKFEVEATAYLGESGRSAARFEAEYDVLLTNRLILQPSIEAELRDRRDVGADIGAGLSQAEAGLRLRYEIVRRFAPYVGLVHERRTHADGADSRETRVVGGVRLWF